MICVTRHFREQIGGILSNMIEQLFGSKTRFKLLKLFMLNPNRAFYVREITRKIDEQINSVRRELSNLLSIGIIKSDSSGNRLYYEVNQNHAKYASLVGLFKKEPVATKTNSKAKKKTAKSSTSTEPSSLGDDERALGDVELVVLSGIFTRDRTAPVDLLIVGNVTPTSQATYVAKLESVIDTEIQYVVLTRGEFDYRRQIKDRFLTLMLAAKLAVKVDRQNILNQPLS